MGAASRQSWSRRGDRSSRPGYGSAVAQGPAASLPACLQIRLHNRWIRVRGNLGWGLGGPFPQSVGRVSRRAPIRTSGRSLSSGRVALPTLSIGGHASSGWACMDAVGAAASACRLATNARPCLARIFHRRGCPRRCNAPHRPSRCSPWSAMRRQPCNRLAGPGIPGRRRSLLILLRYGPLSGGHIDRQLLRRIKKTTALRRSFWVSRSRIA